MQSCHGGKMAHCPKAFHIRLSVTMILLLTGLTYIKCQGKRFLAHELGPSLTS